ncbi:DUF4864 domain-containing protein [Cognatiyoonia sp.]|uniref:DUF4864 domain-containing protein n=1 Tax=Cognatiyoonia sp. TaxID=2211652 RepID=UPI003F6950D9
MKFFGLIIGLVMMASSAFAQSEAAIEDVIGSQLQAFNDRDIENAFQYAAPNIQGMFGNPQNFGMMVQRGYPMVWSNRDVRFLELQDRGMVQIQRLMLRDMTGGIHVLEYQMIHTADGWRIAGVQIVPSPDVGA